MRFGEPTGEDAASLPIASRCPQLAVRATISGALSVTAPACAEASDVIRHIPPGPGPSGTEPDQEQITALLAGVAPLLLFGAFVSSQRLGSRLP